MGIAIAREQIAVACHKYPVIRRGAPQISAVDRRRKPGHYLGATWPAVPSVTGEIHGHESARSGRELWVVNTLFSVFAASAAATVSSPGGNLGS